MTRFGVKGWLASSLLLGSTLGFLAQGSCRRPGSRRTRCSGVRDGLRPRVGHPHGPRHRPPRPDGRRPGRAYRSPRRRGLGPPSRGRHGHRGAGALPPARTDRRPHPPRRLHGRPARFRRCAPLPRLRGHHGLQPEGRARGPPHAQAHPGGPAPRAQPLHLRGVHQRAQGPDAGGGGAGSREPGASRLRHGQVPPGPGRENGEVHDHHVARPRGLRAHERGGAAGAHPPPRSRPLQPGARGGARGRGDPGPRGRVQPPLLLPVEAHAPLRGGGPRALPPSPDHRPELGRGARDSPPPPSTRARSGPKSGCASAAGPSCWRHPRLSRSSAGSS